MICLQLSVRKLQVSGFPSLTIFKPSMPLLDFGWGQLISRKRHLSEQTAQVLGIWLGLWLVIGLGVAINCIFDYGGLEPG